MAQSDPPRLRWFRRENDGQLGYLVERHGKEMIRLDRPAQDLVEPLSQRWQPVAADRPLNRAQVARVAYAADRALCLVLARHGDARKEWASLPDKERLKFVDEGPPADPPIRREIYQRIVGMFPDAVS